MNRQQNRTYLKKIIFASSVSDEIVTYFHSIAIIHAQQFLYKHTSCSLSAIFYGN